MAKRMLWFTGIFSSLTALTTVSGIAISNQLMYLKKKDEHLILERETTAKRYDEYWYANANKSERWIESANGYSIKAIFLEPHHTNRYAIICHGVTENKVNSFKYARMFERLGFNSVVYDHRRHGDSGGKTTSFGHYEKMDLQAIVQALQTHVGPELMFGIHGESMGAATTLLYAGMEDSAAFYISDCAYSDIYEQILHVMKTKTQLPTAISLKLISVFLKLRDGYSIRTVSPREAVQQILSPVLFIHSTHDEFVLPKMTQELYELKPEPKMLKFFEECAHAQSFNADPIAYEKTVEEFLAHFGLLGEETKKSAL
ncbi:alpha/beta hydrolase [Planomicrobium sp. CPCC 101110]|uniref:alpha/beta hydrolase n=1 Tax=Planomicrobium sp. CPCC 101110 TaxID=2599619 RepID=UPI0011B482EE|nr:alpha/beta hydrolase [Planomicrobium sp. CPCC 101110]TWT28250.1 alpha/beta hydrolase [Planomicrobium sp. CPCC 101110]